MKFSSLPIIILLTLVTSAFLYTQILPYRFSPQTPVTENNLNTSGEYNFTETHGIWHGQKTISQYPSTEIKPASVLGDTNPSNKRIEVDLTNQRVYAFEGNTKVYDFLVSTGLWGRTPTGTFTIKYKTRAQKMSGGDKLLGTYYYLPNVPYVQFFGNEQISWGRGFAFHGAYWHTNFGHPMSHGCINMSIPDAGTLYAWTHPQIGDKGSIKASEENPGTPVIIYGITPRS